MPVLHHTQDKKRVFFCVFLWCRLYIVWLAISNFLVEVSCSKYWKSTFCVVGPSKSNLTFKYLIFNNAFSKYHNIGFSVSWKLYVKGVIIKNIGIYILIPPFCTSEWISSGNRSGKFDPLYHYRTFPHYSLGSDLVLI